jgi:hypothetical protein
MGWQSQRVESTAKRRIRKRLAESFCKASMHINPFLDDFQVSGLAIRADSLKCRMSSSPKGPNIQTGYYTATNLTQTLQHLPGSIWTKTWDMGQILTLRNFLGEKFEVEVFLRSFKNGPRTVSTELQH